MNKKILFGSLILFLLVFTTLVSAKTIILSPINGTEMYTNVIELNLVPTTGTCYYWYNNMPPSYKFDCASTYRITAPYYSDVETGSTPKSDYTHEFNVTVGNSTNNQTIRLYNFNDHSSDEGYIILGLLLIPLIMAFWFMYSASVLNEEHFAIKIFSYLLSFTLMLLEYGIMSVTLMEYTFFPALQGLIDLWGYIFGIVYWLFMFYWLGYVLLIAFKNMKRKTGDHKNK